MCVRVRARVRVCVCVCTCVPTSNMKTERKMRFSSPIQSSMCRALNKVPGRMVQHRSMVVLECIGVCVVCICARLYVCPTSEVQETPLLGPEGRQGEGDKQHTGGHKGCGDDPVGGTRVINAAVHQVPYLCAVLCGCG